ncbi:MAG: signal peptidase [Actinomycetota bacterium]|nr:signal peptidase [Actinomycetota bacterium]
MTSGRHCAPGVDVAASAREAARLVRRAITATLLVVTAVLMVASAVATFVVHIGISPILTGSMRGTFDPGAAVITRPVATSGIKPGDVIVFQPPGHTESYAHRVVTVTGDPSSPVITTKGDANPAADEWHARLTSPVAHRVVYAVPHLGSAIVALHQPRTRFIALALAGLVFTAFGVRAVLGSATHSQSRPTPSYAG